MAPSCRQGRRGASPHGSIMSPGPKGSESPWLHHVARQRDLLPCGSSAATASASEQSILREAPQGRSDKMWSESTLLAQCMPGRAALAPV